MLPAKALAKFQCVCKALKNIIRDPQFVKEHFQIKAAKGKSYLLYVPLDKFKIPSEFRDMSFIIIGSCNGVLCFTDANSFGSIQGDVDFALGFGYYEQMNDYFIIRIAIVSDEEDEATCKIEVYSMVASSWTNLEVDHFPWEMIELKLLCVIRFIGRRITDMGTRVFRQKGLPNYKADGEDSVDHIGAKLYTVVIDVGVVTPIMFTNNDEIIFEDGECDLTVCHFESNIISYRGVDDQGYLNFVTYNGSLVMLED
ncbi:hypothetical protein ABFS83_14G125900 [Erythranthe nasuta]